MLRTISDSDGDPAASDRGVVCRGAITLLLGGLAMLSHPALAGQAVQTFGPGRVSCQPLAGAHMDCLLAASRITARANVASFDASLLPRRDQALFHKWCLAGTDACTVTLRGRREAPQSTRLAAVTSVHWVRLDSPGNDAAARAGVASPSAALR